MNFSLDFIGMLCSLASTYYFVQLNPRAWPVGMVATWVNGWLYWQQGIYGDVGLEIMYFICMAYGWYCWKTPKRAQGTIRALTPVEWGYAGLLLIGLFSGCYFLLTHFIHSSVPILDALTTSLSLIAQILMGYKIISTWWLWLLTDSLYLVLYLQKHLPFHAVLMAVYVGIAFLGYTYWLREKASYPKSTVDRTQGLNLANSVDN